MCVHIGTFTHICMYLHRHACAHTFSHGNRGKTNRDLREKRANDFMKKNENWTKMRAFVNNAGNAN